MWAEVSVSGQRFPAHIDGLDSVLLPLSKVDHDAQSIAVHWPGYAEPFRRVLEDPEPRGAGFVRFRMRPVRADGANRR